MNNHALLIGAGGDLPNTIADANGLAKILTDPSRCAFDPNNVKVLTEQTASRTQVLVALDQLAKDAAPDSTVIVYFSGHGGEVKTGVGKFYFLMPFGYDTRDLVKTAISDSEFAAKLAAIPAQRMLLLLDCCHANGVAAQATAAGGQAKAEGAVIQAPIPPEAEKLFAQGSGKFIIASSKAEQFSFTGKPYSLFTRAIIEGLCGADLQEGDGYVKAMDLAMYARQKVAKWSRDKQEPMADMQKADNFRVAYYAGGDTKPKGLEDLGLLPINEEEIARENAPTTVVNRTGGIDIGDGNTINVGGNMVGGNKTVYQHSGDSITIGDIVNSSGVAIGRGASSEVVSLRSFTPEAMSNLYKSQQNQILPSGSITVGDQKGNTGVATGTGATSTVQQVVVNLPDLMPPRFIDQSSNMSPSKPLRPESIKLVVVGPSTVYTKRPFILGVVVQQPSSPPLEHTDINKVISAPGVVFRTDQQEIVKYRVVVDAPDCVLRDNEYTFRVPAGEDSLLQQFLLIPKQLGPILIVIRAYQVEDMDDKVAVANTHITITATLDVSLAPTPSQPVPAANLAPRQQSLHECLSGSPFDKRGLEDLFKLLKMANSSTADVSQDALAQTLVQRCELENKIDQLKQMMCLLHPELKNVLPG